MLLMTEKGIRGGISQAIHRYVKANNKNMKNYYKNIESSYLMYFNANSLYGWAMSQKTLPIFDERSIKHQMKTVMRDIFREVDNEYPKK